MTLPKKGMAVAVLVLGGGLLGAGEVISADTSAVFKSMMHGSQANLNDVAAGILRDDFQATREAASKLASRPRVSEEDVSHLRNRLGNAWPRFQRYYQVTEKTAQELADAAEFEDRTEVQNLYMRLSQSCMNCHNEFRGAVRGAPGHLASYDRGASSGRGSVPSGGPAPPHFPT